METTGQYFVILLLLDGYPDQSAEHNVVSTNLYGPYSSETNAIIAELKLRSTLKETRFYSYHTFIRPAENVEDSQNIEE